MDVTLASDPGYLTLMVGLPLLGAILQTLMGARLSTRALSFLGCLSPLCALGCAAILTVSLSAQSSDAAIAVRLGSWLSTFGIDAPIGFHFDRLSAVFCLVITGVGALIHLYSCVYMHDEPAIGRYFACLNFFISAMLLLVVADNLPLLFVGWEGVGLASFWLIGFWFEEDKNVLAGKKAFVVNRIGDVGLLLSMMVLWASTHTLTMRELNVSAHAGNLQPDVLLWATLGLSLAAIGKSAQVPLYLWLPDAMAGPTPVSALIHAATMVTAGLYLMARMSYLFALTPEVLAFISLIGGMTALWAAVMASAQYDIKKVLAFSTVSQLGFMFMAAGAGAFDAALFHVVTHAFFKACLFLGAGSVIHALGGEQDMRQMGFLSRYLPTTTWTFVAATLAIAGFPLTSGFISKDNILTHALSATQAPGALGTIYAISYAFSLVAALLTSFYMSRLVLMAFFSRPEAVRRESESLHEGGWPMRAPLIVLAFLSLGAGALNWPQFLGGHAHLEHWLEPVVTHVAPPAGVFWEWFGSGVATTLAFFGFALAYKLYARDITFTSEGEADSGLFSWAARFARHEGHANEVAYSAFGAPLRWMSFRGLPFAEGSGIDGLVGLIPKLLRRIGFFGQLLGGGNLQRYLAFFLIGLTLLWFGFLAPRRLQAQPRTHLSAISRSESVTRGFSACVRTQVLGVHHA